MTCLVAGVALAVAVGVVLGSIAGQADTADIPEHKTVLPTVRDLVIEQAQMATRYIDENGVEQNGSASASPVEGGRLIMTPRYSLRVPDDAFPQGYTWEFAREGMACAPDGVRDVLTVTDAATGELSLMVYCVGMSQDEFWAAYEEPGESLPCPEGYRAADGGEVSNIGLSSETALVVFALPEGRASVEEQDVWNSRIDPTGGSYRLIQGMQDVTAAPEAYVAWAMVEDGRLRITTPFYTVLLPEGWTADSHTYTFDPHDWRPSGCELLICGDGRLHHIFLRTADTSGSGVDPRHPEAVVAVAPDGRELVVDGYAYGGRALLDFEDLDELIAGVSLL